MIEQIEKLNNIWVQVNHFTMHARVSNKKINTQDIVLVHGIGSSSHHFTPLGEYLAPIYNVYIPDLPGFGKSKKPKRTLNLCELANALYCFTQAVGIENPILLGNSFGCQIIVHSIIQHPLWAASAILIGPTIDASKRTIWQQLKNWLKNMKRKPFTQIALAIKDYITSGIPRVLRTLHYALKDEIEKKLPNLNVPTLIVREKEEEIGSTELAEKVTKLLPRAKLIILPNKDKLINTPRIQAQIIHDFLATHFIGMQQKFSK